MHSSMLRYFAIFRSWHFAISSPLFPHHYHVILLSSPFPTHLFEPKSVHYSSRYGFYKILWEFSIIHSHTLIQNATHRRNTSLRSYLIIHSLAILRTLALSIFRYPVYSLSDLLQLPSKSSHLFYSHHHGFALLRCAYSMFYL